MISFKDAQSSKDVTLFAVFFYLHDRVLHRYLEEIIAEQGGTVDHAILN